MDNQSIAPNELKKLFKQYSKTLNNENQDELYTTEQGFWEETWPGFLDWYKKHLKTSNQ